VANDPLLFGELDSDTSTKHAVQLIMFSIQVTNALRDYQTGWVSRGVVCFD